MAKKRIGWIARTFSFNAERDREILDWLDNQENASQAVRDIISVSLEGSITLEDIYREIKRLQEEKKL
jgi:hypothetical protein